MTEEAKRIVETLRYCEESGARCESFPSGKNREGVPNCHSQSHIADLIEQLYYELELAQQVNAGLDIMLTAAQSAAETFKRQLDAAIRDWKQNKNSCFGCKHFFENRNMCSLPIEQRKHSFGCWEWRGLQEKP